MINNPYANYKRTQIETAGQGRLLLLLYNEALKNLHLAQECIRRKEINQAHNCLLKTQDIIMRLNLDLNMDAGEIATNLRGLYLYLHQRLVKANLKKDTAVIQEVTDLLTELKQGWDTIITKKKSAATTAPKS